MDPQYFPCIQDQPLSVAVLQGFDPSKVPTAYGDTLTFWDWEKRKIIQQIKLGADGLIPLETRFLHDPSQAHGYVGAALSSNVIHFTKVLLHCISRMISVHAYLA